MRLLFVIDPPSRLNPRKDSTIALMRAAVRMGDEVFIAEAADLGMDEQGAFVLAQHLQLYETDSPWFDAADVCRLRGGDFDSIFMRLEPPVDIKFLTATLILDELSATVPVFNRPRTLREANEKLSILHFPKRIPPTIVSARMSEIVAFHSAHGGAVIKPLNGMGGSGVYVSPAEDKNLYSVMEMIGSGGELLMAQKYIPAVRKGDARVFVIDGRPAEYMLLRVPQANEHRSNMATGGDAQAMPISDTARSVAEEVGVRLVETGVLFAGLDIIGDYLTEINITCPTGLCEVRAQTGKDLAEDILTAAQARLS